MSDQLAQALELGLDAAKTVLTERKASFAGYPHKWRHEQEAYDTIAEAIVALAAHEAAPQQEPAITVTIDDLDLVQDWAESRLPPGTHKLYAAPQQAQAPIDPDGEESRAGFRAFDEAQMARWATPWQVWREAVKWAAQPVQQAQAPGWRPIETAPENLDSPAVVFWRNAEGEEQSCFDYTEDGCWMEWHSHAEHVEIIGGHGVSYTPPYTHWMPLPAAPQQGSNT